VALVSGCGAESSFEKRLFRFINARKSISCTPFGHALFTVGHATWFPGMILHSVEGNFTNISYRGEFNE